MKQKTYRGEWAGCSDLKERREELSKAHEEFQKMLDNGYQLKEARVKRPRIKKQPSKMPFTIWFGITADIPMEILIKAGFAK